MNVLEGLSDNPRWLHLSREKGITKRYAEKFNTFGKCPTGRCKLPSVRAPTCSNENVEVTPTLNVMLPFFYTKGGYGKNYKHNYDPYDMFTTRTKMLSHIKEINPSYDVRFEMIENGKIVQASIELYQGDKFVPIEDSNIDTIEKMAEKSLNMFPEHALVLNANRPVLYNGYCINENWMKGILNVIYSGNHVRCSEECNFLLENDAIYQDGILYGKFNHKSESEYFTNYVETKQDFERARNQYNNMPSTINRNSYTDKYNSFHTMLIKFLLDLYIRGSVFLNENLDSDFIEKWELLPFVTTEEKNGIYICDYRDTLAIPDPTHFLNMRLQGKVYYTMDVNKNNMQKISERMRKETDFDFKIFGNKLYIDVENLQDVKYAYYIVRNYED